MQLKHETLDSVDEGLRDFFVPFKEGDKEVFVHKDYAEALKESYRAKGDLTQTKSEVQELREKLSGFEQAEQERRKRQEQEELDGKRKSGKHDEIIADLERKLGETKENYEARINELVTETRNKEKNSIVADLASAGTESTRTALKRLIAQDLDFTDDGKLVVIEDGKATSTSLDDYKASLRERYPSLIAEVQSSGGQAKGGLDGGSKGSTQMKRSDFEKLDHGSRQKFFNEGGKLIDD